jgi:hypothetical protein
MPNTPSQHEKAGPPPGADGRRGLRYELLGCARHGHELIDTDARRIDAADALVAREPGDGARWHRCLRCDAWVPMPPPENPGRDHVPDRDEVVLPLRGRPLKSRYILRLIAVTRAVNFVVLALGATAVFAVLANQDVLQQKLTGAAKSIQGVFGGQALTQLQSILSVGTGTLWLVALGVVALAACEAVPRASGCGWADAGPST